MLPPLLLDATILRNFVAAQSLDVLEGLVALFDPPRWTDTVRAEIARGAREAQTDCVAILAEEWLGPPLVPTNHDQKSIQRLRVALGDSTGAALANSGEAESIALAERLDGAFATDDNAAYDLAWRRLGEPRTYDTVDLLRIAVDDEQIESSEAAEIATAVRNAGRYLRRLHPPDLQPSYFGHE